MGIIHLEELNADTFINIVVNINDCVITEKLDGTNIVVGMDESGRMYTSREAKGSSERVYFPTQYNYTDPVVHGNILVSEAIGFGDLLPYFKPNQAVVCELLFGRQPNAIVYGDNHLVFLHPYEAVDNPWLASDWERLQQVKLRCGPLKSYYTMLDSQHGVVIKEDRQYITMSGVPHIDSEDFTPDPKVYAYVSTYQDWLDRGSVGSTLTNRELISVNLTKIPKNNRPDVKKARDAAREKSLQFKSIIKGYFHDILADITPSLRTTTVTPSEDFGIEGVVLTTPDGMHVKIVNKMLFTSINAFNHTVRNRIRRTSYGTVPDGVDWGVDFGRYEPSYYDHLLSQIQMVHNIPGLTTYVGIKPILRKYKTDNNSDTTVSNIAADWGNGLDAAVRAPIAVRGIIANMIRTNVAIMRADRDQYMVNFPAFYLRLDDMEDDIEDAHLIGYTRAVHHRTMLLFAEVINELEYMADQISFAEDLETIIMILFQKQLLSIH